MYTMSMLYQESTFVTRISPYVLNFKQKKPYLWGLSCPICGDVSKGKQKARGYLYRPGSSDHLNYKCHHCGASMSFGSLLKTKFPELYKEFVYSRYELTSKAHVPHKDFPSMVKSSDLSDSSMDGLKPCENLESSHPVAKYLIKRMIPPAQWKHIYYTLNFMEYTNSLLPEKFRDTTKDHPRLILPYLTEHGKMFAYVARAFGNEEPKYFTIKLDDEKERIYGIDRLKHPTTTVYAVEGPIDSLFLPNAIAVSGSSFDTPTMQALKSVVTIVGDNEPRSREIVKILKKNIDLGYKVCMLPHRVKEKDINEMIMAGMTSDEIVELIDANTFQGINAQLKFVEWKLV